MLKQARGCIRTVHWLGLVDSWDQNFLSKQNILGDEVENCSKFPQSCEITFPRVVDVCQILERHITRLLYFFFISLGASFEHAHPRRFVGKCQYCFQDALYGGYR